MAPDPDSAARRRRGEVASLGLVVGFAWTLVCLLLTGGSDLSALAIVLLWLGGVGAVAAMTALALRLRAGQSMRHIQPRRRHRR